MATYAAANYGCQVTTTTISQEQREGALRRIRDAGVEDRVTVLLEDYRDLRGRYTKLVSLEMIEAVGWQYFDEFFRRCSELLEPDGLFFLQAIVIDDRLYETEKAARSFANTLIFPGGCLPSVEVIQRCTATQTDMSTDLAGGHRRPLRAHSRALARALHRQLGPRGRARLRRAVPAALDALARDERGGVPRATATGRAGGLRQATALQ